MEPLHLLVFAMITLSALNIWITWMRNPRQLDGAIINQYRQVLELLFNIQKNQKDMNAATKALLDGVLNKVTAQGTVIESGVTLLTSIKAALDAAVKNAGPDADPEFVAEVQGISDNIGQNTANLANSIAANTPVSNEPPATHQSISLVATTGEVIVIDHVGTDNVPAIGDSATVNGVALSGTGASYSFADGSSITLDDQSKVSTYNPTSTGTKAEA